MKKLPLAGLALLASCVSHIDEEVPRSSAGEVAGDCIVPLGGRGAPAASLEYEGRGSLWLWDDARALVPDVAAACAGAITVRPGPTIALTAAEQAVNAGRSDGRRLATAPRGGFVAGGRGFLYFDLELRGPGFFDVARAGTGLCELEAPDAECVRRGDLLWTSTPERGGPGIVEADGYAYLFACSSPAALESVCTSARVRPEQAGDPSAYELAGAFGGWGHEPGVAGAAVHGSDVISVGKTLGRYAAVVRDVWAAQLLVTVADAPQGPYQRPTRLFDAVPPQSFFIAGGLEHAALRAGDAQLVVSYSSGSDLHLVSYRLDPENWP